MAGSKVDQFNQGMGGLAIGAVFSAWFIGPLIRFADPALLAIGGGLVGTALFCTYRLTVVRTVDRRLSVIVGVLGSLGTMALVVAVASALTGSMALDAKCAELQAVALNGEAERAPLKPGQAEPKDQFTMLQCRPRLPGQL